MLRLSRRRALAAGLSACALALPSLANAGHTVPGAAAPAPATVKAVRTGAPVVALTFDDGPHPTLTPYLLDILRAYRVRATFFVIGSRVAAWPAIVRRIADEGHEIGNHSWSHPYLDRLSDSAVLREVDRTTEAIYRITGRPPVTFRPPYGAFTHRQRRMLQDRRFLPTVLWSVDPQDWRRPGPVAVANRILGQARPGAIILSHDIQPGTVDAMPATLDGLRARGLQPATVSSLIGWPLWQQREFHKVLRTG